jgi:hypothetical protein
MEPKSRGVLDSPPSRGMTIRLGARVAPYAAACSRGFGSLVCIVNAVLDALSEYGITHIDMPLTPERVWRAIQDAKAKAAA